MFFSPAQFALNFSLQMVGESLLEVLEMSGMGLHRRYPLVMGYPLPEEAKDVA
jgi:hypothetical protein